MCAADSGICHVGAPNYILKIETVFIFPALFLPSKCFPTNLIKDKFEKASVGMMLGHMLHKSHFLASK